MDNIEITCKVNGKETPITDLSSENWAKIHKVAAAALPIPVAQLCRHKQSTENCNSRLILQISDSLREAIAAKAKTVIIDLRDGMCMGSTINKSRNGSMCHEYVNHKDLTPKG